MGFLSSLFGGAESHKNTEGMSQEDGSRFQNREDGVFRRTDDTQAHTTMHFDIDSNLRGVNNYGDDGKLESKVEFDSGGNQTYDSRDSSSDSSDSGSSSSGSDDSSSSSGWSSSSSDSDSSEDH